MVALLALAQLDPGWAIGLSVAYVMAVQGASGVAKDLATMSSKSAVKLLAPTENGELLRWVALLTGSKNAVKGPGFLLGTAFAPGPAPWLTACPMAGLLAFGAVFAINSWLHSYLILAFTRAERVTMDVGFYYMANAGGRLMGTLLSGLTYQAGGWH